LYTCVVLVDSWTVGVKYYISLKVHSCSKSSRNLKKRKVQNTVYSCKLWIITLTGFLLLFIDHSQTVPWFSPIHKEGSEWCFILLINIWLSLLPPSDILWTKIHYHVTTMECNVTWCKHSSKTDLLLIVCEVQKYIESTWPPWKLARFVTFVVLMTIGGSLGHVLMV